MKIGIVTAWFERGAAYVSKIYMDLLVKEGHEVYIYARGGEDIASQKDEMWNQPYVTREETHVGMMINKQHFFNWIRKNKLDVVFFNEQQHFKIVAQTKSQFPDVKIGSYIDYYTENTLAWFDIFDFIICNTHRHMQAMHNHPQKYYIRWGTDTNLYSPRPQNEKRPITFFHSAGMSARKGTDILVDAFIEGKCYERSKLVIHSQIPIDTICEHSKEELQKYNIEVIEKTVSAPGLYFMGDVYVYPTRLDGLGLTMYEALSSGLPVITTNFPPMNEAIVEGIGKLVDVEDFYCREDAYYYPMAICNKHSLIEAMNWYIENPEILQQQKKASREFALENYNISARSGEVSQVFKDAIIRDIDNDVYHDIMRFYSWRNSPFICYLRSLKKIKNLLKHIKK